CRRRSNNRRSWETIPYSNSVFSAIFSGLFRACLVKAQFLASVRHPNLSCGGATASHASALETKTAKSLVRPADYAILSTIMLRYKWHLCIMLLMTWSCRPGDSVPDQLIGTWQTATAAHAGSSM